MGVVLGEEPAQVPRHDARAAAGRRFGLEEDPALGVENDGVGVVGAPAVVAGCDLLEGGVLDGPLEGLGEAQVLQGDLVLVQDRGAPVQALLEEAGVVLPHLDRQEPVHGEGGHGRPQGEGDRHQEQQPRPEGERGPFHLPGRYGRDMAPV